MLREFDRRRLQGLEIPQRDYLIVIAWRYRTRAYKIRIISTCIRLISCNCVSVRSKHFIKIQKRLIWVNICENLGPLDYFWTFFFVNANIVDKTREMEIKDPCSPQIFVTMTFVSHVANL